MNLNIPYVLVGIIGTVAWAAIVIVWIVTRNRSRGFGEATQLIARVDAIDTRLAAVEKTLNDIP